MSKRKELDPLKPQTISLLNWVAKPEVIISAVLSSVGLIFWAGIHYNKHSDLGKLQESADSIMHIEKMLEGLIYQNRARRNLIKFTPDIYKQNGIADWATGLPLKFLPADRVNDLSPLTQELIT